MPKYHYTSPSLLDDISFYQSEGGTSRAYLHAAPHVSDNQLAGVMTLLRQHDYDCVPYDLDGKPVLEVRNYGRPNALLGKLKKEHIIAGEPAIQQLDEDITSLTGKLSKRTLQLSGAFQLLSDAMFYRYNKLEGHTSGSMAGYFYTMGTLAVLGFGNNDQSEFQVKDLAKAFENVLEKKGVAVPDGCALHAIAHEQNKSPLHKAHELLSRYPSEAYNLFTGMAGVMMTVNAYNNHYNASYPAHYSAEEVARHKRVGLQDMGLGLTTLAATTYGLLVKEKKPDPDEPKPTTSLGTALQYVKHNPLSVTGAGLLVSSVFHTVSTIGMWKNAKLTNDLKRKKSVPWRAGFVGATIIGELLIMLSSKGHGEGVTSDDTVHKTAYKMAAEVILSQPPEHRAALTQDIADFLQAPDVLAEKHETVVENLKKEMQVLKQNPWRCRDAHDAPEYEESRFTHAQPEAGTPTPELTGQWHKQGSITAPQHGAAV